jgi:hypothetical protein
MASTPLAELAAVFSTNVTLFDPSASRQTSPQELTLLRTTIAYAMEWVLRHRKSSRCCARLLHTQWSGYYVTARAHVVAHDYCIRNGVGITSPQELTLLRTTIA